MSSIHKTTHPALLEKFYAIELYNFARWVAESNAKLKDETVAAIEKFLKTYLVNLSR